MISVADCFVSGQPSFECLTEKNRIKKYETFKLVCWLDYRLARCFKL